MLDVENECRRSCLMNGEFGRTRFLDKLRCPACRRGTFQQSSQDQLRCEACKRSFPIMRGIADLSYFPESSDEAIAFNNTQAQYERQVHEDAAQGKYEQGVIRKFGDKTEAMSIGWAEGFPGPFLDFGCGTGQVCRSLRKYHADVYAFDISVISVEKNVRDNNVLGVVANAFYVPFANQAFATVCCNGVLHHIIDLESAIDEMARVSDRYILISEGCIRYYYPIWLRLIRGLRFRESVKLLLKWLLRRFGLLEKVKRKIGGSRTAGRGVGSKYERPLDPKDIVELLKRAGFRTNRLRFWTNLNWRRRSRLKKFLIRMMVSGRAGTHFEIQAERDKS